MKDQEFFHRVLGLVAPWEVKAVHLEMDQLRVRVEVEARVERGAWKDSQGREARVHGWENKRWRHMDTMQLETVIEARVPRLLCEDGHTEMAGVPWAEAGSRFTALFEGWCVRVLMSASSVQAACGLLKMDWDAAHRIMERAVQRGMTRRQQEGLKRAGIDEKSFLRGQSYVSLLTDLDRGCVVEVVRGADTQAAEALWQKVPQQVRSCIEAVAMDMSAAFLKATHAQVPQAEVAHDKFHVAKYLSEAVDAVRRQENEQLAHQGDQSLAGTRWLWLFNPENMKTHQRERFDGLLQRELQTAHAWAMKELWAAFWQQPTLLRAKEHMEEWIKHIRSEGPQPMRRVAEMIHKHKAGILAAFVHGITNALTEGINSKIQAIKSAARGFRNFAHYRIRILFFCGKLDLMPHLQNHAIA